MLTTAIPTVILAHAVHGALSPAQGTPSAWVFLAFVDLPVLLLGAALLLRSRDSITSAVCMFSAAAAQLHALATPQQLRDDPVFGAFFVVITLTQIAWIVAAIWRPSTATLAAGVAVNLAVLAVWAASRTTGLPTGPRPWMSEPVGLLDLASGAYEVAIVAGCLWLARTVGVPTRRPVAAAAMR